MSDIPVGGIIIVGIFIALWLGVGVLAVLRSNVHELDNAKKLPPSLQTIFDVLFWGSLFQGGTIIGRPTTYKELRALPAIPFVFGLLFASLAFSEPTLQWHASLFLNFFVSVAGLLGVTLFYYWKYPRLAVALMLLSATIQIYLLAIVRIMQTY